MKRLLESSTIDGGVMVILTLCLRNNQNHRSQTVTIRNIEARHFDQEHRSEATSTKVIETSQTKLLILNIETRHAQL